MVPAAALSGDQRKLVGACGLHTGVLLAFNRKTNRECFRLFHPRVCISGGIQPKILRRCLTEDFFDRGLPARFLFAWPPGRQDQWTEATVPEGIHKATLRIFERLFGLQPGESEPGDWQPILVTLAGEAKNEFVAFYNSVAANAMEVSDREEAAWTDERVETFVKATVERLSGLLDAREAPMGTRTVVLASEAGGTMIHEAIGHGLEADLAMEGLSCYKGMLGQAIAGPLIDVVDDKTLPFRRGTYAYDDEGTASQGAVLVEKGVLEVPFSTASTP